MWRSGLASRFSPEGLSGEEHARASLRSQGRERTRDSAPPDLPPPPGGGGIGVSTFESVLCRRLEPYPLSLAPRQRGEGARRAGEGTPRTLTEDRGQGTAMETMQQSPRGQSPGRLLPQEGEGGPKDRMMGSSGLDRLNQLSSAATKEAPHPPCGHPLPADAGRGEEEWCCGLLRKKASNVEAPGPLPPRGGGKKEAT
jgi:hypothetical protein